MKNLALALLVLVAVLDTALAHGRLRLPLPRRYTYKTWDGGEMAPVHSCTGPRWNAVPTGMRCHGNYDQTSVPKTVLTAGSKMDVHWELGAQHPGDCSLWISYDTNTTDPENWIKLYNWPGCGGTGFFPPRFTNTTITLPSYLPPCDHCVLRWEWYAVHHAIDVEFYAHCADVQIKSQSTCLKPSGTTFIGTDVSYLGPCPYYNVYYPAYKFDPNRMRGPKVWSGSCAVRAPAPPAAPAKNLVVYDNKLNPIFNDWSWGGGVANFHNLASTALVSSKPSSISFIPGNWNALYFTCATHGCYKSAAYGGLSFMLHGGKATTRLMVRLRDASFKEIAQVVFVTAEANKWKKIQISFDTNFRIKNTDVLGGLQFQAASSATRPVVYIDDITLVGRGTKLAPLLSDGSNSTDDGLEVDADGYVPDKDQLVAPLGLEAVEETPVSATSSASSAAAPAAFLVLMLACLAF